MLDFDVSDCTGRETPLALRTPTPRPVVVAAAVPVACRPSCLLFGGCATCDALGEVDEDAETQVGQ